MDNSIEESLLNSVFTINRALLYSVDDYNIVTIIEPQEHVIQRFFRRLGAKIPMSKKIVLDSYSSFVFLQINGVKTIKQIGEQLEDQFGEAVHPLYQRLLQLLTYMEIDRRYITRLLH